MPPGNWRRKWTQKLKANAPSCTRASRIATGGRTSFDIQVLHQQSPKSDPMGKAFDYAKEFKSLDLNAVIKDLNAGRPTSAITAG